MCLLFCRVHQTHWVWVVRVAQLPLMLLVRPTWTHSPPSGTRWVALAPAARLVGSMQLRHACVISLCMFDTLAGCKGMLLCLLLLQFESGVLPEYQITGTLIYPSTDDDSSGRNV
jgi:hypothetical protein